MNPPHAPGTEAPLTSAPRYTSLRDYLRVLRANRVLIVVMTIVFGGATYAVSKQATKSYTASATVALQNPTQAFALAGLGAAQNAQIPLQTPAINAASVGSPGILRPAAASLRHTFPHATVEEIYAGLSGAVGARVEASTNLVVISAGSSQPGLAAKVANAVAESDVRVTTQQVRAQLRQIADGLEARLSTIAQNPANALAREQDALTISRLRGLATVIVGAQIQTRAFAPAGPSSPKPTRNAVLAALVGLTLAIVIAFLRASLDRRVRSAAQIRRALDVALLGRVPESALGRVGTISNGRKAMSPAEQEAFRILRANLDLLSTEKNLHTLAVTSPLPDEGKSTVAASLAFASAWAGRRTLLIEADLRRPSLAKRARLDGAPGLTELLSGYAPDARAPIERFIQRIGQPASGGNGRSSESSEPPAQLEVITSGKTPSMPAELLGGQAFRELLNQVREQYEMVILDTPPILPVADAIEILPQVDAVLICVRVGRTRADELSALRSALDQIPPRSMGLVVTGLRPGDESDYGYYAPARA